MRRRRRPEPEGPSKERWLVSYSDFVTVLFGFFVLMYAMSSVDEGQYQRISDQLRGVFSGTPRTIDPIQVGDTVPLPEPQPVEDPGLSEQIPDLGELREQLSASLSGLIDEGDVTLREGDDWIELTLSDGLLFEAAATLPGERAFEVLSDIAALLEGRDNAIRVEGFTDNLPIRTEQFPSNWELSAARAAAVVRILEQFGIASERLSAVGYGENHPVARNDTTRGRQANRRVVLLVSASGDAAGMRSID